MENAVDDVEREEDEEDSNKDDEGTVLNSRGGGAELTNEKTNLHVSYLNHNFESSNQKEKHGEEEDNEASSSNEDLSSGHTSERSRSEVQKLNESLEVLRRLTLNHSKIIHKLNT